MFANACLALKALTSIFHQVCKKQLTIEVRNGKKQRLKQMVKLCINSIITVIVN